MRSLLGHELKMISIFLLSFLIQCWTSLAAPSDSYGDVAKNKNVNMRGLLDCLPSCPVRTRAQEQLVCALNQYLTKVSTVRLQALYSPVMCETRLLAYHGDSGTIGLGPGTESLLSKIWCRKSTV